VPQHGSPPSIERFFGIFALSLTIGSVVVFIVLMLIA
jgi:hypothetical protein